MGQAARRMSGPGRPPGYREAEHGAPPIAGKALYGPTVAGDDRTGYVEAEPDPRLRMMQHIVDLVEALEHSLARVLGNPGAAVGHADHERVGFSAGRDVDGRSRRREA
jgi:hypothetical protein